MVALCLHVARFVLPTLGHFGKDGAQRFDQLKISAGPKRLVTR